MEVTHNRIDVPRSLASAAAGTPCPVQDVIAREAGDVWLVSHDAIQLDQPIKWLYHQREPYVMIPLVPYLTYPSPDLSLAFLFQLGVRVALDLSRPVRRLHLSTGYPVEQVYDAQQRNSLIRYYLGFAVLLG